MNSVSVTPWYLDKALYVTVLGMVLPFVGAKLGVQIDPVKVAGYVALAVGYVVAHKWKSGTILAKELELGLLSKVTVDAPAAPVAAK